MSTENQIRPQLIQAKKIQLHSGMEGFDSPEAYGIYRHTGGAPLGVTGRVFEPPDLNLLLGSTTQSIKECGAGLNLDKLEYQEMKGGSKIRISIPGPTQEIKGSPMVGDVFDTRLDFTTGFDGLTKTTLSFFSLRLWCENGAKSWQKDVDLAFKNTPGNQGKWLLFCDQIFKVLAQTRDYAAWLSAAVKVNYTQADKDAFFTKLLGYSEKDYKEMTTRKRNILDKINAQVAIEANNTGHNMFSLIQGITRYTTHDLAGRDNLDGLLTDNAAKISLDAHRIINDMVYAN